MSKIKLSSHSKSKVKQKHNGSMIYNFVNNINNNNHTSEVQVNRITKVQLNI